jgi:hypothetical protein
MPGKRWRTSLGSFVTLSCIEVGSFGAFSRPPFSRLPQRLRSSRFSPFSRNGQPRTTDHERKIMPPSSIMSILHGFAFPFRNFLETVIATIDATDPIDSVFVLSTNPISYKSLGAKACRGFQVQRARIVLARAVGER